MPLVVVGAGPGMGAAIARAVGREHGPVALIARRRESLARIADDLGAQGVVATAFPADIARPEQLQAALAAARSALGPPTVVVFNASVFVPGPPSQLDVGAFTQGLATGLTGAVVTLREVAEDLRAGAPGTSLLFTGGGLAFDPSPAWIGLAIQKAGLRHLALSAAQEFAGTGVHVAIVTIRGTVSAGGPFDPDRIAAVYAALAGQGERPVEVTFTESGPDWVPRP